jgi:tRNA U34 2-thiouridine synthase MnmA/TrmU
MSRAIALYSGGLDSILAILVVMRQGVEVAALTFLTRIGCALPDKSASSEKLRAASERFGFTLHFIELSEKFISIVKNPKYGYGKNMNPCLDCKILMLKEARQVMINSSADFIITGEVLSQRPMSQRRDTFPKIDREAGVKGIVLRPLSARLLKPTIPEMKGLVDRESLYALSGRSRKPQISMAQEFGLTDYPQPAGGCLLTDPIYSFRLKELLARTTDLTLNEMQLLRVGRHFRASDNCKIIVGRNEQENEQIQRLVAPDDYLLWVEGYGSPMAVVQGIAGDEALELAASLCVRYSDAKDLERVEVDIKQDNTMRKIIAAPASQGDIERHMITSGKTCRYQNVKAS